MSAELLKKYPTWIDSRNSYVPISREDKEKIIHFLKNQPSDDECYKDVYMDGEGKVVGLINYQQGAK